MGGFQARRIFDPFNVTPKMAKGPIGKFMRGFNKVIDPLNIMDPMGVLPTSWVAGKKAFTFDNDYGGAAQSWLGLKRGSAYSPTPFNSAPAMELMKQQQGQNSQALADIMQLTREGNMARQEAQAGLLAQQNQNLQSNIQQGTQLANQSLAAFSKTPANPPAPQFVAAVQPANQQLTNKFTMPNTTGLTFGGV